MTVWYISPCFGKTDNSTPGGQRGFPSHTSSRAWQHDAVVISVMKISDTTPCLALNLVYNVICLSDRFRSLPTGNPEATEPNSSQNSLSIHQHQTPPASLSIRQRCLNPLQIFGYTTKTRTGRQTHRSAIPLKKPPSKVVDKTARRYSTSTTWSTWHTWDYLRYRIQPPLQPTSGTTICPYLRHLRWVLLQLRPIPSGQRTRSTPSMPGNSPPQKKGPQGLRFLGAGTKSNPDARTDTPRHKPSR